MPVIGLIGPHAVGKTTAVKRWVKRYPGLIGIIADNQLEITAKTETRVKGWKGEKPEKQALTLLAKKRKALSVIDSGRGFTSWIQVLEPCDPVIVLTCSESDGRRFLVERRKGKLLSPFWSERRLEYECIDLVVNAAKKWLKPDQYKHFVISDREKDWELVDEYFHELRRRILQS